MCVNSCISVGFCEFSLLYWISQDLWLIMKMGTNIDVNMCSFFLLKSIGSSLSSFTFQEVVGYCASLPSELGWDCSQYHWHHHNHNHQYHTHQDHQYQHPSSSSESFGWYGHHRDGHAWAQSSGTQSLPILVLPSVDSQRSAKHFRHHCHQIFRLFLFWN